MSPSLTAWPSSQRICLTVPGSSASTGISIFMDSRITTVSPSPIVSPTWHSIFQTVPVMCASMSDMGGTIDRGPDVAVLVTARDEAQRIGATLAALRGAFPGARIVVADDASGDATPAIARAAGAEVVRAERPLGKGGAASLGAVALLSRTTASDPPVVLLADGDLGASARGLTALVAAVADGRADVAVARFARRRGGGVGLARGVARAALRRLTGLELDAPLSGQRALRGEALACVVPFAPRFGMEVGMTVDAHRAGFRVLEVPVDLEHRATGATARGFAHRARQLRDLAAAAFDRR